MHLKTTFFLLLVLGVVLGVIWIVGGGREPFDQAPAAEPKLLLIEPEKIAYVSFYRNGKFVECKHEHGQWMIYKPVTARADSSRIHRILAGIEMLPRGETITLAQRQARGLTLNDYGLSKPRMRMVLGSADRRYLVAVGNVSSLKNSVYVQLDHEDEVVATTTNLLDIIPRHVEDIRDTRLIQGSASLVRRLEIKRGLEPWVQLVKEGNEWVIHKPIMARAGWMKVSRLLNELFSMVIRQFVSETMADPVAYGLNEDDAVLQIGVWQEGEKAVDKLVFGKKADEQGAVIYAGRRESSSVFTVSRDRVDALLAVTADLHDPRLYFMAPEKMAWIRIEEGEHALEFCKRGDAGWQIVEPKQWKADSHRMADLISRLNTFRVDKVMDGTPGMDKEWDHPARIIRVAESCPLTGTLTQNVDQVTLNPAGELKRALWLSPPQSGKEYVLARFEDEPRIYRISASSSSTISLDPLNYRDYTVLALDPSVIRKITLKKNGKKQIVKCSENGTWTLAFPSAGEVNSGAITNLLAKVVDLKVLRFERSNIKDLAVYGLKEAPASLTFSLSGKEGIQKTLLFGEPSEDLGVYAMFQGQDMVFVLEEKLVDALIQGNWINP